MSETSANSSRMNVEQEGDVVIIELKDRKILEEMSIMQIGEQLNAMVAKSESPKVIIDFTQVAHMSSSALGILITLHKRIREKRGQLRLCCIQSAIYEIFVITRLNEIFSICQSRQEALGELT
ncbi:MAG: STAS domain-containing protein [Phycisphaerae bacterium]|nr:STAS domain-containing protein [Phycisphaerae bacterium]